MRRTYEKREATGFGFGGPSERYDDRGVDPHAEVYRTSPPEDTGVGADDMAAEGSAIGSSARLITGDITVRGAGRHLPRLSDPVRSTAANVTTAHGRAGNLMSPRRGVSEVRRNPRRKEMSERGKGER